MKFLRVVSILAIVIPGVVGRLRGERKKQKRNKLDGHFRIESLYVTDYVLVPPEKNGDTHAKVAVTPPSTKNVYWTKQCSVETCTHGSWFWEGNLLKSVHRGGCLAFDDSVSASPGYFSLILSMNCNYGANQKWKLNGKRICSLAKKKKWCVSIDSKPLLDNAGEDEYNGILTTGNQPEQQIELNTWPPSPKE